MNFMPKLLWHYFCSYSMDVHATSWESWPTAFIFRAIRECHRTLLTKSPPSLLSFLPSLAFSFFIKTPIISFLGVGGVAQRRRHLGVSSFVRPFSFSHFVVPLGSIHEFGERVAPSSYIQSVLRDQVKLGLIGE